MINRISGLTWTVLFMAFWCAAAALAFTLPTQARPKTAATQFANIAPCYSGICASTCRNRKMGIPCATYGGGDSCSPSIACRGIILMK